MADALSGRDSVIAPLMKKDHAKPESVVPAERPKAVLTALIGSGIGASRSPDLHEREGRAQGLTYIYRLIDLLDQPASEETLSLLLSSAVRCGFDGLNITHPCKQAILPLLDELDASAATIGAVNTVRIKDGRTTGFNTDAAGFGEAFTRDLAGAKLEEVVQLGAGGAGAATAYAILELGAEQLTLVDKDLSRADALARTLCERFPKAIVRTSSTIEPHISSATGLIHATPTGMSEYPGLPLAENLLRSSMWVAEIVYMPLETQLLKAARAAGCRTMDGSGMVVLQAAKAFEIFTGQKADSLRMKRIFNEIS